jgi:ornithine cyclodeaminase
MVMIHISEEESSALASHELAFKAVRMALIAAATSDAETFPVVLGHASDPQNRFTIKSTADARLTGLKVGSYFPTNDAWGGPRHNSFILLFDQAKGRIGAVIEGTTLNAYRTAAANAVATDALARNDAKVLALFGTGHQAGYEAAAVARVRNLERILIVGRDPSRAEALVGRLRELRIPVEAVGAEVACRAADIVVTATTATAPLFSAVWVRPGTHISSMGSDRTGKQELPTELFEHARLFCDLPEQSRRIGEFQHAAADLPVTAIGDVLEGHAPGRSSPLDVTIFDSSGIALQDLYIAEALIALRDSGGGGAAG